VLCGGNLILKIGMTEPFSPDDFLVFDYSGGHRRYLKLLPKLIEKRFELLHTRIFRQAGGPSGRGLSDKGESQQGDQKQARFDFHEQPPWSSSP
jgi:hypothetical protein